MSRVKCRGCILDTREIEGGSKCEGVSFVIIRANHYVGLIELSNACGWRVLWKRLVHIFTPTEWVARLESLATFRLPCTALFCFRCFCWVYEFEVTAHGSEEDERFFLGFLGSIAHEAMSSHDAVSRMRHLSVSGSCPIENLPHRMVLIDYLLFFSKELVCRSWGKID